MTMPLSGRQLACDNRRFTSMSIRKLQEIHAATHPAKLEDHKALLETLREDGE